MNGRNIWLLAIPLAAGLSAGGLLLVRSGSRPPAPERKPRVAVSPAPPVLPTAPAAAPTPAPPKVIAKAMDEVRMKGLYDVYRTAVATGDERSAKNWLPNVLKQREAMIKFAREDLATSSQDFDRNVALRILEILEK